MNNKFYLGIIALVCLAIFFTHLDVVEVNIMEARNFITAREMLDYGHWFHTTMNLEPRYEKPPLPTWMTALSLNLYPAIPIHQFPSPQETPQHGPSQQLVTA